VGRPLPPLLAALALGEVEAAAHSKGQMLGRSLLILITGFIICIAAMIFGAVLAFSGEYVRPALWVIAGLSFLWFMWELSHF
jgi:hypothetical protein